MDNHPRKDSAAPKNTDEFRSDHARHWRNAISTLIWFKLAFGAEHTDEGL